MKSVLRSVFTFAELRKKILFTLFILGVYRLGSHIPVPGIDLQSLNELFSKGGVLGFFNLFSGGNLSRFSIFGLGILPYINASIIMQLSTIIWPSLKELSQEGDYGRKQIAQYTRYLAVGIAFIQASVMSIGFKNLILPDVSFSFFFFMAVMMLVGGASLVMWFGEVITEKGIGNGASLLIFIGIIAQMPQFFSNTYILIAGGANVLGVIVLLLVFLLTIMAIVYVQEAQRKIHVQYAKRLVGKAVQGGNSTYIPLKLIQGGVMPIIFASALLQFPLMLLHYFQIKNVESLFSYNSFTYNISFCLLIFFFTYFYTAITFNPQELSDNIKKYGGFIVGVRPGKNTVDYLDNIVSKLTLFGAFFLASLALIPVSAANITKVTSFMGLGGTALLIIVGVALDLMKQIDAYVLSRKYDGFL